MDHPEYWVEVSVTSRYLPEQSAAEKNRYVFAYTVTLVNRSVHEVQLLSRYWRITDGHGQVQIVQGSGVVGEQPRIAPGQQYRYSSGSVLPTAVGVMQGHYQLVAADGYRFEAPIVPFRLSVPGVVN